MAPDPLEASFLPITWNSEVRIVAPDALATYGFEVGAVVGLTQVDSEVLASNYGVSIGSRLVDVEGPRGETVTVRYEDLVLEE